MTFLWPEFLWSLAALPLLVLLYWWLLSRRRKAVVQLASVAIVRKAIGRGPGSVSYTHLTLPTKRIV